MPPSLLAAPLAAAPRAPYPLVFLEPKIGTPLSLAQQPVLPRAQQGTQPIWLSQQSDSYVPPPKPSPGDDSASRGAGARGHQDTEAVHGLKMYPARQARRGLHSCNPYGESLLRRCRLTGSNPGSAAGRFRDRLAGGAVDDGQPSRPGGRRRAAPGLFDIEMRRYGHPTNMDYPPTRRP